MNEREVNASYRLLQKEEKFRSQIANIERLKKTVTPQKNMELKTLLVGASQRDGSLLTASLRALDKKINQIDTSMSKESMAHEEKTKQLIADAKIQRSVSMRNRKLKNKFHKTRRFKGPGLSPIREGSRESRSKSPWRTIPSEPKKRRWFFVLF
jgi:hypothetical protein